MNLSTLLSNLPEYAKDTKLNVKTLLSETDQDTLTHQQRLMVALASAYSTKNTTVIAVMTELADERLSATEKDAARGAASLMAMNNVYYRFIHLASNKEYGKLPAQLRMNYMQKHGIEPALFEMMSLAVSAINGCGLCIDSHEKILAKSGIDATQIQTVIRIAASLQALAQVVVIEADSVLA